MAGIRKKRRAFVEQRDCVACGCCVKVCPLNAIQVYRGLYAQVEMSPNASAAASAQRNVPRR